MLPSVQCQVAVLISVSPRALTFLVSNERAGPSTVTFNLWLQIPSKMWLLFCLLEMEYFCLWKFHGLQAQGSIWLFEVQLLVSGRCSGICLRCSVQLPNQGNPGRQTDHQEAKKCPNVLRSAICDRLFLSCLLPPLFPRIWRRDKTCLCVFTAPFLWQILWKYRLEYLRLEIIAQALSLVQEKL